MNKSTLNPISVYPTTTTGALVVYTGCTNILLEVNILYIELYHAVGTQTQRMFLLVYLIQSALATRHNIILVSGVFVRIVVVHVFSSLPMT